MDELIIDVRKALIAGLFPLSLQSALALVDVCAALSSPDGRTRRTKFEAWFAEHAASTSSLSPADAYELRCGLIHQGRASAKDYDAVIFTLPGRVRLHNVILDDVLCLDLATYCNDLLNVIDTWWQGHRTVEPVRTNAEATIRVRPDGFRNLVVGSPILA